MEFVPGLPVLRRCVLQTLSALRGIEAGEVTQFHRDRAGRPADQGRKRLHLPVRFVELPEGQLQVQRESELQLRRSEEHTSELQSLMRISSAVFCLKKKRNVTMT